MSCTVSPADSAIGVNIITDDRSSCMFSGNEEVIVYVFCSTTIYLYVSEKIFHCAKVVFVLWSLLIIQ